MKSADQSQVDQLDRALSSWSQTRLLATARVRLDCLVCADHVEQRMDDGRATSRFHNILDIQGCLRWGKEYYVKVLVDADDWNRRLALRNDGDPLPELTVPVDYQLKAYSHRHLLEAAQPTLKGTNRWWVVEVYRKGEIDPRGDRSLTETDGASHDEALLRTFRERRLNEGPEPDGVIYYRIRFYQGKLGGHQDQNAERDAWVALLNTPGSRKKYYLERFLQHPHFPQALDRLIAVRGLAAKMKIGNLNNLINLRCDEV